jgi:hypothetical protein
MKCRQLVAAFGAFCLLSAASLRGDFTTIINAPPDVIPANVVFGPDTQINLLDGAITKAGELIFLGGFNSPAENTELNLLGGNAWAIQAWTGSQLNIAAGSLKTANLIQSNGTMSGGVVERWSLFSGSYLAMSDGVAARIETAGSHDRPAPGSALFVMTGGEVGALDATGNVVMRGGTVDNFIFRGGGFVQLTGGAIGDDFKVGGVSIGALPDDPTRELVVGSGGRVTVRGGEIGDRMILHTGRTLDYSGGLIGDGFQAHEGSQINIRGTHFLIDGVELNWPAGERFALTQRDAALEGVLADGQTFRFDLNSQLGLGDYFSPEATVTIMFVPEPRSEIVAILLITAFLATYRARQNSST